MVQEIIEGYIPYLNYKTYYRIANPKGKKTPLLILHGGPGSTHNGFELFDHMAFSDDRPIVLYDQLGCGKSAIEDGHKELWRKEVWANELINLRNYLHLDEIFLMGQSWGGMLNIIYNSDYNPKGVKGIILASTLSSVTLWREETHRLVGLMGDEEQRIIKKAEEDWCFTGPEIERVYAKYYHTYIGGPWKEGADPECLTRKKNPGTESYMTAWGPSEFSPKGTLEDYEYTDKLKYFKAPVLITSGANDESTPYQNKVMYDCITSKKKWILYKNSRHMSYYEEHDLYVKNLLEFLHEND